jgi:hypothetical protein
MRLAAADALGRRRCAWPPPMRLAAAAIRRHPPPMHLTDDAAPSQTGVSAVGE